MYYLCCYVGWFFKTYEVINLEILQGLWVRHCLKMSSARNILCLSETFNVLILKVCKKKKKIMWWYFYALPTLFQLICHMIFFCFRCINLFRRSVFSDSVKQKTVASKKFETRSNFWHLYVHRYNYWGNLNKGHHFDKLL